MSQSVFAEESQLYAKHHFDKVLCRKCKVSVMLASQCSHCAELKKGLCCHPCTEETEATVVCGEKKKKKKKSELDGVAQLSTINTTTPVCVCVCLFVLLCCY